MNFAELLDYQALVALVSIIVIDVVLAGYNAERSSLLVLDPYQPTPYGPSLAYWIGAERVLGAVMLGIVTHDANLLVVHPKPVSAPEGKVSAVHFEPL